MKKFYWIFILSLLAFSLQAREHYVYKASIFKIINAKLTIDVDQAVYDNSPVLMIKSNSYAHFLGSEVTNIDYIAYNDINTFEPKLNVECEHAKKQNSDQKNNCRAVKALPLGQFLYRAFHSDKTPLEDLDYGMQNVTLENVNAQQPTFNPNTDKVFDIASIVLLVKYLNLNKDHREQELFVAVNRTITKIKATYVQDIDANKMWIKLDPLWPGPENYKTDFPHKIIFDRRLKAVTEVHKKLQVVGDIVISLDKKASSFK